MKWLWLILFPSLAFPQMVLTGGSRKVFSGGGGAPVASDSCGSSGGATSLTCTYGSSFSSGDYALIIWGALGSGQTLGISGCGATWTTTTLPSGTGASTSFSIATGITGSCAPIVTTTTSNFMQVRGAHITGSTGIDVQSAGALLAFSGGVTRNLQSVTTTVPNDLVLVLAADAAYNGGASSWTAEGGATILTQGNYGVMIQTQDQATASAVTPSAQYALGSTGISTITVAMHP